jgi:hypothetical protein
MKAGVLTAVLLFFAADVVTCPDVFGPRNWTLRVVSETGSSTQALMASAKVSRKGREVFVGLDALPGASNPDPVPGASGDAKVLERMPEVAEGQGLFGPAPRALTPRGGRSQPAAAARSLGSSSLMGDVGTPVFIKLILRRSFNGDNTDVPRSTDTRHI